ncbi:carbohydrate-binding module family 50 protein, partial [Amniculicola lignicola CBS 123094]
RGDRPQYFTDPATTKHCTWYHDNVDNSVACTDVPGRYGASMSDFLRWNPTVGSDCAGYNSFQSYCVEAFDEPTGGPTPTPTSNSPTPPTSSPGNGITTPQPTQPGMVGNCNKFYFVQKGQGCTDIATLNGVTFQQLLAWNSGIGSNCEGLWANVNLCVGIVGFTPTPTPSKSSTPPTTPTPTNGIQTPLPTQPGMVGNCDRFYYVNPGDECGNIAASNGITVSDFVKWNPGVGNSCSSMWANAYVCVRVVGFKPPTTTINPPTSTKPPGNGITTPTPTQVGMVSNCNKFYYVRRGDNCESIAKAQQITVANFIRWNPAAKSDCTGLWADTYACV